MKQHLAILIRDRAKKHGDREVFRYFDQQSENYKPISWNAFVDEVDAIALALIRRGFGHESKIGILSNNTPQWLVADFAIMTIRGITVPFYSTAAKEQIKYIVDETGMEILFAGNPEQLEKAFWLTDHCDSLKQVVLMDPLLHCDDKRCTTWKSLKSEATGEADQINNLLEATNPNDLATIIYTSGTTGEPKGVMMGQENFMHTFGLHDQRLNLDENDVSLCFLPLSHIFERTWSYYLLHVGATNVLLENPKTVIDVLPVVKPSLMCTVPRFFEKTYEGIQKEYNTWPAYKQKIFDWAIKTGHRTLEYKRKSEPLPAGLKLKNSLADKLVFKKLRQVFGGNVKQFPCSGAAIRIELLRYFHAVGIFINYGYGATETTATVSCFKDDEFEFESCGTVLPGVSVKFSENKEIMVRGKTVFRGYYKKPEKTAEVMEDGWYKTGDEGHLSSEGNLVMTERLRNIIKTSVGKYVSPQKIELLLGNDDYIEQIAVIGDDRKFISALIVPDFDRLKAYAEHEKINYTGTGELVAHQKIIDLIDSRIAGLQSELTSFEKVVRFTLLPEPFSIENQALTTTLKLRRKVIEIKYRDVIDKMYLPV